jgi:hypothetical protein
VNERLPTGPEVAGALERVYARPEFQPRPPGVTEPIRAAIARAWAWVRGLLDGLPGFGGDSELLERLLVIVLVVAAAAIVAYLLHQTLAGLAGGGARASGNGPDDSEPGARSLPAAGWEALAARLAADSRHREAALALYQALLLRLEHRGALRYDAAKTPGDYLREARAHPQGRRLATFLRAFEPVAFGGRPIDHEGYARLRAVLDTEGAGAAA